MIKIDTEFITLGQLLKMTDWISSGGEAKLAVKELKITVNGEKEDRRGRKLYPGDQISICLLYTSRRLPSPSLSVLIYGQSARY